MIPMVKPKKKVLMKAGKTSKKTSLPYTSEKNRFRLTASLRLMPKYEPYNATASAKATKTGSIMVVEITRVTTTYLNGLIPDTSMASICSVTLIDASSAPMPEPTFPAKITAVITGPISRMIEMATMDGIHEEAPNCSIIGLDWM